VLSLIDVDPRISTAAGNLRRSSNDCNPGRANLSRYRTVAEQRRLVGSRTGRHGHSLTNFNKIGPMGTPIGPRRITRVRQVAIPAKLMKEADLSIGDDIYLRLSGHHPNVIEIVPARVVNDLLDLGLQADRSR